MYRFGYLLEFLKLYNEYTPGQHIMFARASLPVTNYMLGWNNRTEDLRFRRCDERAISRRDMPLLYGYCHTAIPRPELLFG